MSDLEQEMNTEENGRNEQNAEESVDNSAQNVENKGESLENGDNVGARAFSLPDKGSKNKKIMPNREEEALQEINKGFLDDPDYAEVEDLEESLETYKKKFLEFDKDTEGNIDMFGLARMLEKVGKATTHLKMKEMIREIDSTNKGTICYRDFIAMMLGPKSSVLKRILFFEEKMKPKEIPTGVAPKRDLASLP